MTLKEKIPSYLSYGKKVLKSKDGKTIAANFTYLSLLQIASYIFPFITIPYLSRVIGVEGFGRIAFAGAIMVWIQTIVDWGFGYTGTREVAKNRDNKDTISSIYSNILWAKTILAIICFCVMLGLIYLVPVLRSNAKILLFTFLLIPGHIVFPEWLFQGLEKMKYITIFNLAIKFFFTIAIFFIIKTEEDYIYQPLLTALGYIASGIIASFTIRIRWGIYIKRPNAITILKCLKESFDIFLGNLFPTMYNNFSVVLLGAIGSPTANGIYDGGNKFVNIIQQFMGVIGRTIYPYMNRQSDKHSIYARLHLLIATVATVSCYVLAPVLVHIFLTPEFEDSIVVLKIMSLSIFFLALCSVYQVNYLYVHGHDKEARNCTVIASLIGFVLAYPMIKYWGYIGAALNVTFTRAVMGILNMVVAKKFFRGN